VIETLVSGKVSAPYYYVPMLITFLILSPILVWFVQKNWKRTLASALVLQAIGVLIRISFLVGATGQSPASITRYVANSHLIINISWFILGITYASRTREIKELAIRLKHWLIIGSIIFLAAGMFEWEIIRQISGRYWIATQVGLFTSAFQLCFLIAMVTFRPVVYPKLSWLTFLGVNSYGIFLVHVLVQEVLSRTVYHVSPEILSHPLIFFIILTIAGLGFPSLMIALARRSRFQRMNLWLFG
jgi:peptidoglycan/LPS O-acetylase OafA/YrhL